VRAAIWLRDAARLESPADPLPEQPGTPWSGWRDFEAGSRQCVVTLGLPVTAKDAVQVVVGVQASHPQAGAHGAVEVMALSALRTGPAARGARPGATKPDAALAAVALRPAPRFRSARMGGPHGQGAGRHLEFMVLGLSAQGQSWPALRFRLGLGDEAGAWVEIRQGKGWPEVLEAWPGTQADAQGPFLRLGSAGPSGPVAGGTRRDGLMLAALLELMPVLVEQAAAQSQEVQAQIAAWQAAARQVAAAGQQPSVFRAEHRAAEPVTLPQPAA
jgi:hypothetical protein